MSDFYEVRVRITSGKVSAEVNNLVLVEFFVRPEDVKKLARLIVKAAIRELTEYEVGRCRLYEGGGGE